MDPFTTLQESFVCLKAGYGVKDRFTFLCARPLEARGSTLEAHGSTLEARGSTLEVRGSTLEALWKYSGCVSSSVTVCPECRRPIGGRVPLFGALASVCELLPREC